MNNQALLKWTRNRTRTVAELQAAYSGLNLSAPVPTTVTTLRAAIEAHLNTLRGTDAAAWQPQNAAPAGTTEQDRINAAVAEAMKKLNARNNARLGLAGNAVAVAVLVIMALTTANTWGLLLVAAIYAMDMVMDVKWYWNAKVENLSKEEVGKRFLSVVLNLAVIGVIFLPLENVTPQVLTLIALVIAGCDTLLEVWANWDKIK